MTSRYPTVGPLRVAQLAALVLLALVLPSRRAQGGVQGALVRWIRRQSRRLGAGSFEVDLVLKRLLVVNDRELSRRVLAASPDAGSLVEGESKRTSMAFLAPMALTISHGADWTRRRSLNEEVLGADGAVSDPDRVRSVVQRTFGAAPPASVEEVRSRMRMVMEELVFGAHETTLGEQVDALMTVVRSPLRRLLLGRLYGRRRKRFYTDLRARYGTAPASTLVGSARSATNQLSEEETLEQIPHWMFTFTGSGTDLLVRTLALIGSRPVVLQRIREADQADRYLEACLLEAGRLYPPVVTTFHRTTSEVLGSNDPPQVIPEDIEIAHYFPLERDASIDPTADEFAPDRWLDAPVETSAMYPNLFLSGPRSCPGRELITLVCTTAIASISAAGVSASARALTADPLPRVFPTGSVRFSVAQPR
jgi:cytochrome P450